MVTSFKAKTSSEQIAATIIAINDTNADYISSIITSANPKMTPVYTILDLSCISTLESPAWFRNIRAMMKQYNMTLIGVRDPQLNLEVCKALKIPVIDQGLSHTPKQQQHNLANTYIHKPVRSGQQVYAQNGSLIITNSVSAGSEIAAKDDIHVFHSCNGKVIAGTSGQQSAVICLFSGYPELISIAGITLHSDQLSALDKPTLFYITNGQLSQRAL